MGSRARGGRPGIESGHFRRVGRAEARGPNGKGLAGVKGGRRRSRAATSHLSWKILLLSPHLASSLAWMDALHRRLGVGRPISADDMSRRVSDPPPTAGDVSAEMCSGARISGGG